MCDGGEEPRCQGEVDEDEERPDGGEDHEAVGGGGQAIGCDLDVSAGLSLGGPMGRMGKRDVRGDVPWAVSPRTMMAKRACTARKTMMIKSSIFQMWVSRLLVARYVQDSDED